MTNTITDKCIECGSCAHFCEKGGIDYVDGRYVIDQEKCDGCDVCKEYCPIDGAIITVSEAALESAA